MIQSFVRQEVHVNTKLTLRLDDELIASAKRHSAKAGKSVSRMVADYFALNALISDDMTMSFFAQVVAGFMHSARYLGHQWRTPKHVNTANASRMINLQAESKRLVADGSGRLYFADSAPPSKAIDYNSVYRRKPNMRHPYVNPY